MTPIHTNSFIKKAKNIAVTGTLATLLIGQASLLQSCSSSEDQGDYEVSESYTQGVKTYLKETSPGEFKITDEIAVAADSSQVIITYLDGRTEKLNTDQAKAIIDKDINQNQASMGHSNSLSNVLLYGGMGYFLGRTMSPGYGSFRPDLRRDDQRSTSNTGFVGNRGRFYADNSTYQKSNQVHESINRSRTTTARPRNARSGFFGRSSRGGFGG
jgi:hypothetical protein